jgi:hypothetical protein
MKDLLRLSKVNQTPGFPLRASTLYKWIHTRKHPELFVRLGSAVFVDIEALNRLIEKSRGSK